VSPRAVKSFSWSQTGLKSFPDESQELFKSTNRFWYFLCTCQFRNLNFHFTTASHVTCKCAKLSLRQFLFRTSRERSLMQKYDPEINIILQFPSISCNISRRKFYLLSIFHLHSRKVWNDMDCFYLFTRNERRHCMRRKKNLSSGWNIKTELLARCLSLFPSSR